MKRQGKTILISLLVAAALMIACAGPASPDAGAPQTQAQAQTTPGPSANEKETQTAAPEVTPLFGAFKAEDSNGNEVTQEIFAGHKLTMVNIWATFCGPCLREMPELGELDEEYRDQGFQVVGMPTDVIDQDGAIDPEQVALVNEIAEKTGADYPHILPTQELVDAKLGSVTAVPETVFVDENGNQVGESYRGARDKAAWKEIIDGLLASMPDEAAKDADAAQPMAAQAAVLDANIPASPVFYQFEAQGLDGKAYTDEVLNQNPNQALTLALVWDPSWEGSGEALSKLQEYLETDDMVKGIGFVLGADGKEQEAVAIAQQAGAGYPQLLPTAGIEDIIVEKEPQLLAITPWGSIRVKPLNASEDMQAWKTYIDDAVIDVTGICCG